MNADAHSRCFGSVHSRGVRLTVREPGRCALPGLSPEQARNPLRRLP